ncbi:hypothetical protein ACTXT7_004725 [Hymenolepis weldensis]
MELAIRITGYALAKQECMLNTASPSYQIHNSQAHLGKHFPWLILPELTGTVGHSAHWVCADGNRIRDL